MSDTPDPAEPYRAFGPADAVALGNVQQIVARRMAHNWATIPHVTHNDDLDVTALEDDRAAAAPDQRLTPLAYLIRALALALREFPQFNASLSEDGKSIICKDYCHVGMAIDVAGGLVVGVLRDCDTKDVPAIAEQIRALAEQARDKGLPYDRMVGGCITVSSLGGIGGTGFSPIINAPEVAIVGVSRTAVRPVWNGSQFVPRSLMPVSLSYDHRVINGADAARFCRFLADRLAEPAKL